MKYCNHPESETVFSKLLFLLFLVLLLLLLSSLQDNQQHYCHRACAFRYARHALAQQGEIRFGLYRPMAAYRAQGRHGVLRQSEN